MDTLPQIIYIALTLIGIGFIASKHGKPQQPYNFWASLFSTIFIFILLYFGGFFNPLIQLFR
jgi:hypothetical protein